MHRQEASARRAIDASESEALRGRQAAEADAARAEQQAAQARQTGAALGDAANPND